MDPFNSKKQSIKVIVSEAIMFLAVVVTVIILALLVSGYWLNSDFKVERNGMLQISSVPTGANIEIDGESSSWLERTNSSKILKSGEHHIVLTKDGYDSWSKTINISEGLLYRLHYPRLFLDNRTAFAVFDTPDYTSATISSSHNSALLMNDTTKWTYLDLDTDSPKLRTLDISKLFSSVTTDDSTGATHFTGNIVKADWDVDASHVLYEVTSGNATEWVLLDVNNVDKSINLTKEFDTSFSRIEILDNNSNNLLAIRNHNLHKIDIPGRLISAILVKDIEDFDHFNNEIVFSAHKSIEDSSESDSDSDSAPDKNTPSIVEQTSANDDSANMQYVVGLLKLGDAKPHILTNTVAPAKVTISKFYDSKYITIVEGQHVSVHQKDEFNEKVANYDLSFLPDTAKVGHDGEFIILSKDHQLATLDMEANLVQEWIIEGPYGWIDNDMLYTVSDGNLIVYDYDGLNRRIIAEQVSSDLPVTIVGDKWLYYFKDGKLMREWLIPR